MLKTLKTPSQILKILCTQGFRYRNIAQNAFIYYVLENLNIDEVIEKVSF